jgi:uncharacterized protein (DUF1501 family)
LGFVQSSTASALSASERVEQVSKGYKPAVTYPGTDLAEKLKTVAQLIDAGLGTRIYYVALDGFDTHSQQAAAHAGLMEQLGGATAAFVEDLARHGHADRVLVMSFSEFGRRVQENASGGTDHGEAAPMFLFGSKVRPGLHEKHPSLESLHRGDLAFGCDFRRVYASVLRDWLKVRTDKILPPAIAPLPVIKA